MRVSCHVALNLLDNAVTAVAYRKASNPLAEERRGKRNCFWQQRRMVLIVNHYALSIEPGLLVEETPMPRSVIKYLRY